MYRLKLTGWTQPRPKGVTWKDFLIGKPPKSFETVTEGYDWLEANLMKTTGLCPTFEIEPIPMSVVWQYGIIYRRGEKWDSRVLAQMQQAHRYQNDLIEVENSRRAKRREVESKFLDPALEERLAQVQAEMETIREAAKGLNQKARANVVDKKALNKQLKPLKDEEKPLKKAVNEARKAIRQDPKVQAQLSEIDTWANEEGKILRARYSEEGLFWGTYVLAENAVKAAASRTKGDRLRFQRWTGEGGIRVQIQGGMTIEELFACNDTRAQIEPVDPKAWDKSVPKGERKRAAFTKLRLRIGSDEGRDPIWAEFNMRMHRPFPPGARIKEIHLHRKLKARQFYWAVDFTINIESPPVKIGRTCAIDLGWRKVEDGLRVATLTDDDGNVREFVLPQEILDKLWHSDKVKSTRDLAFNEARKMIKASLPPVVPEWFKERSQYMMQWRAKGKLIGLYAHWKAFRFEGDEGAFSFIEQWYHDHKHYDDWFAREFGKACNRRNKHLYRNWAAEITDAYGKVILEKLEMDKFVKIPNVEDEKELQARFYREKASLYSLSSAIKNACSMRGVEVVEVDPAWTTQSCHECGVIESWNPADELIHKCRACGAVWDQDVNAGKNLLQVASG